MTLPNRPAAVQCAGRLQPSSTQTGRPFSTKGVRLSINYVLPVIPERGHGSATVAFAAAPLGLRDAAVCSGGLTSKSEPFHWLGSLSLETKTLARVLTEPPATEPLRSP